MSVKKSSFVFAAIVWCWSLVACGSSGGLHETADAGTAPTADAGPGGRWPACAAGTKTQTLSFVHVNDLHANYQLDAQGVSPYSRIHGYYESVLAGNPYTVFTNGGDDYEKGALAEVLSQGASTRAILDAMRFDVRVIGNHDYAWSEDEVLRMSHDAYASVLESNVTYTGSSSVGFGAGDFVALQIGCVKVGFAGLVSQPWNEQDQQIQDGFYGDFKCDFDFSGRAQEIVTAHRQEVDLLVFVDHIGLGTDGVVALTVPGIDVVLSGHSHDLTTTPNHANGVVIVQSGAFAEHVLRLDVTYDLGAKAVSGTKLTVMDVGPALPPSAPIQSTIAQVLAKYAPTADDPVAEAATAGTSTSIATIAAKGAIAKFGVDAAVVDTQTVWTAWPAGKISDQAMLDAFKIERELSGTPGFNSFYTAQVTGADLQTIASGAGTRFVVQLPASVDPAKTYALALPKRVAYQPATWFPALSLPSYAYGAEAWEVLDAYGRQREHACLYIDSDVSIPGCTPSP